jgi:hypothetical protein
MIIESIPFLQRVGGEEGESKVPTWRFSYLYSNSVLVVTGICSLSLKQQLERFTQASSKHLKSDEKNRRFAVTILHEGFFTLIDGGNK